MSLTVQSFTYNQKTSLVDLSKVPELSSKSREELKKIDSLRELTLPLPLRSGKNLQNRISRIREVMNMLERANDNRCRNTLIALIKSVIVTASLAFTIKFATTGDDKDFWMIALGIVCYIYFATSFYHTAKKKIERVEEKRLNHPPHNDLWIDRVFPIAIPSFLGMGIILPLYEALTKRQRLNSVLSQLQEEIRTDFKAFMQENSSRLVQAFYFYRNHSELLLQELDRTIQSCTQELTQNPSNLSYANDLRGVIDSYHELRNELSRVIRFYKRIETGYEIDSKQQDDVKVDDTKEPETGTHFDEERNSVMGRFCLNIRRNKQPYSRPVIEFSEVYVPLMVRDNHVPNSKQEGTGS